MAESTEPEINLSAPLIQLPPYNPVNPRSWFIQLEAIFASSLYVGAFYRTPSLQLQQAF